MPVNPNFLERLVLFRLNRGPAPMLDLFGAGSFEVVTLASEMGVFEVLAEGHDDEDGGGGLTLSELADRLDADEKGLHRFLGFLEAQGYVAEDTGRYSNTRMTSKWLTPGSKTNMAPWLVFWRDLVFPFWDDHLETVVRKGKAPTTIYEWFDEEPSRWDLAQRGFRAAASIVVEEVAEKVDVPDREDARLLDVGGGHGLYSIELCRRHPDLSATVFDYPEALAMARVEVEDAGLEDRVATLGGDYWTDDFGVGGDPEARNDKGNPEVRSDKGDPEAGSDDFDGYDLALVFNVIHAHDAEANVRLFRRVADALAPGGRIAVLDQLEGSASTPVGAAGLQFVGLTYLVTLGASVHPYDSVADWLRSAGFEDVRRTSIRRAGPGNSLVQATKPPE